MNSHDIPDWSATMARALEGDLGPAEIAEFEAALTTDPELAATYEGMRDDLAFWNKVIVPVAATPDFLEGADDLDLPAMPESVLARLESERRRLWSGADTKVVSFPVSSPAAKSSRKSWLALAAAVAVGLIGLRFVIPVLTTSEATARITLLAPQPAQATSATDPVFVWANADPPGQRYDVWLLPEGADQIKGEVLAQAENVVSPLSLAAMKVMRQGGSLIASGGSYQALICLAGKGRRAGVPVSFTVAKDAAALPDLSGASPGEASLTLNRLMADRPGDALMLIERLPATLRALPEIRLMEEAVKEKLGGGGGQEE